MSTDGENDLRNETTYISPVKFNDIEKILIDHFGDKFKSYRVDYHRSLNYDKLDFIPDFPLTVSFELVNRCNLNCVMCYTDNHKAEKATLSIEAIRKVMDECRDRLPAAVLGMGSESLLYKKIRDVIVALREAGVMDVFFSTNGTLLTEEMSEFLVEHEIARVEVSIDAVRPETYAAIRGKDLYNDVVRNVRALAAAKRRRNSTLPVIRLSFCSQPLNVAEAEAFTEMWKDDVDYIVFQQMVDFSNVNDALAGTLPETAAEAPSTHCAYPFNSLNVWANGDVTPCCTFFGKALVLGNIGDDTLADIWTGAKLAAIRRQLLTRAPNPICKMCLSQRDGQSFNTVTEATRGKR